MNTLPTEPSWAGKRVNYGKDRCAYIPKSQQAAAQQAQAAAAQSLVAQSGMSPQANFAPFSPYASTFNPVEMMNANGMGGVQGVQGMNRTVYLGNVHPETTAEDLCNAIRGGVLQSIRYMQDKHIAVRLYLLTVTNPPHFFLYSLLPSSIPLLHSLFSRWHRIKVLT